MFGTQDQPLPRSRLVLENYIHLGRACPYAKKTIQGKDHLRSIRLFLFLEMPGASGKLSS